LFQHGEGPLYAAAKLAPSNFSKLRLRVMDVKNVNGFERQILARSIWSAR
jgi:hypothetical protein